jgi:hypothetical protein
MKLFLRKDLIIIAAVVLLIIISALLFMRGDGNAAARLNIYVGSKTYKTVEVSGEQTITVDQGDGKINVIEITKTGVRMKSSTCPNQDCVMKGELPFNRKGSMGLLSDWIVCLPNGVSVEITPGE